MGSFAQRVEANSLCGLIPIQAVEGIPMLKAIFKRMHETIHQAFEARARERKDAVALKFGENILTYEELDARSNQLAARLRKMGVGPEMPVALYLDRSLEMVVSILGVLKAG